MALLCLFTVAGFLLLNSCRKEDFSNTKSVAQLEEKQKIQTSDINKWLVNLPVEVNTTQSNLDKPKALSDKLPFPLYWKKAQQAIIDGKHVIRVPISNSSYLIFKKPDQGTALEVYALRFEDKNKKDKTFDGKIGWFSFQDYEMRGQNIKKNKADKVIVFKSKTDTKKLRELSLAKGKNVNAVQYTWFGDFFRTVGNLVGALSCVMTGGSWNNTDTWYNNQQSYDDSCTDQWSFNWSGGGGGYDSYYSSAGSSPFSSNDEFINSYWALQHDTPQPYNLNTDYQYYDSETSYGGGTSWTYYDYPYTPYVDPNEVILTNLKEKLSLQEGSSQMNYLRWTKPYWMSSASDLLTTDPSEENIAGITLFIEAARAGNELGPYDIDFYNSVIAGNSASFGVPLSITPERWLEVLNQQMVLSTLLGGYPGVKAFPEAIKILKGNLLPCGYSVMSSKGGATVLSICNTTSYELKDLNEIANYYPVDEEFKKITAITLHALRTNNTSSEAVVNQLCIDFNIPVDPILKAAFTLHVAIVRWQHPEWSNFRVYWEVTQETLHMALDGLGLIPVIGEACDLTNGAIYTIQGDGLNASLSFASALPIVGWASTGGKYAIKIAKLPSGAKTALKFTKQVTGKITFGNRGQLRKVLGLVVGDARQAHHLIPWEFCDNTLVQKAADAGFHMNEALNGIPLSKNIHVEGMVHDLYNNTIRAKLDKLVTDYGPDLTPQIAETELKNLILKVRTWIINHPGQNINNLVL